MPEVTTPVDHYGALFARRSHADLPLWLPPLQRAAQSRFAELGFPGRNDEEWRFTDVRPIAEIPFGPAGHDADAAATVAEFEFEGIAQIVFVNGRYQPALSTLGDGLSGANVIPI